MAHSIAQLGKSATGVLIAGKCHGTGRRPAQFRLAGLKLRVVSFRCLMELLNELRTVVDKVWGPTADECRLQVKLSVLPPVVLIVEDDLLIRMQAADIVQAAGFRVIEAKDADDAIAILEARADIAVIFTDIQMPGSMDGLRLAAAVRDRWPPIKIIVTSGQVRIGRDALPDGGQFLPKPYSAREVAAHLKDMTGFEPGASAR